MRVGLLIYDSTKDRTFSEKVSRAAARYREKYGRAAQLCYVRTIPEGTPDIIAGVLIAKSSTVQVDHLWLGVREQ